MPAPLLALLAPLLGRFAGGSAAKLATEIGTKGLLGTLMGTPSGPKAPPVIAKPDVIALPNPQEHHARVMQQEATQRMAAFGKALGMVSGGAVTVTLGLKHFAERLVAANEGLRYFNGQIANAYARLEYGDIRRQFSRAQGTAASAALLAKQVDAMRNVWNDIGTDVSNLLNLVGSYAATAATIIGWLAKIGAAATPVILLSKAVLRWLPTSNETDTPGVQFLQDVAREAGKRKLPPLQGFENPEGRR